MSEARAARIIDKPEPGFWMLRLVRGGAEVPAAIMRVHTTHEPGNPLNRMERSPFIAAFIAGEPVDIEAVWHRRGRPISEPEYRFQMADMKWVQANAPDQPKANPTAPVNLLTVKLPF